ncbi:MAG: TIGR01777 family protein [Flavobacterium sp.]|nr:TIGR01777 family protein [Flavobacterium sp.]
MRILITGATGLVGSEIVSILKQTNTEIHFLSTSKDKLSGDNRIKGFYWDPQGGIMDENALIGVDAIIHLAGASIDHRWTEAYKQEIIESRVFSTNLLYTTLKHNPHQVTQIVAASAIGIYPDSLSKVYTEASQSRAEDFLGHVVVKWENGLDKFSRIGIKVCKLRTGLVLSDKGGALPQMAKPVKLGLGAAFGSGKQIQSWIHISDLARMYLFALTNQLEGVYNAVAPNPVSNQDLTRSIANVLSKNIILPNVPKFAMKIALGEMHQLLFTGQFVSSDKISETGFNFQFSDINDALRDLLQQKSLA